MSENVMSTGIMVPLNRKLSKEELSEYSEELYDRGSIVRFNYEGTLAYTDEGGEEYGLFFGKMTTLKGQEFDDLNEFGLSVDMSKAKPYRCYWYNGVDSDMDMITLEEFINETE